MAFSLSGANINAILLDIEGTTTPISFVYEILFPFARLHLKEYLLKRIGSRELEPDVAELIKEHAADLAKKLSPPPLCGGSLTAQTDSLVSYMQWLMDHDRKSTGLKSVQGKIWQQGYENGTLRSQLFADVPSALRRWRESGARIAIFSSGSVLAQRLLFAHTDQGDLTGLVDKYFDTNTGPKQTSQSYRNIAAVLQLPPSAMLFISDVVEELNAALAAGMKTLLCVRPGNHPQPLTHQHSIIQSLDEISE